MGKKSKKKEAAKKALDTQKLDIAKVANDAGETSTENIVTKNYKFEDPKYHQKKRRINNKVIYNSIFINALVIGAVVPGVFALTYKKKPGETEYINASTADAKLVELINQVDVSMFGEDEAGINPVTIADYNQEVINSANWTKIENTPAKIDQLKRKLNLRTITLPEVSESSGFSFYYKLSLNPHQTNKRSTMVKQQYLFEIKISDGNRDANKSDNSYILYSSDRISDSIGTGDEALTTLTAWMTEFNEIIEGRDDIKYSVLNSKIKNSFTPIDNNAQAATLKALGFMNVDEAIDILPYGDNGAKIQLEYRFQWIKQDEGDYAVAQLTLKGRYPTMDGKFVEYDNSMLNGVANTARKTITSTDRVPFTPTDNEKLISYVDSFNGALSTPQIKTIAELEPYLASDWEEITDFRTISEDMGFASTTLESIWNRKNIDIYMYYKFEKVVNNIGQFAQYRLSIRGAVPDAQLEYSVSDKQIFSKDRVPANPTDLDKLIDYMEKLDQSLTPRTDKTIEHLNKNTASYFQQFSSDSTLSLIGFDGANLSTKPADVTLWYKLELEGFETPGVQNSYILTLRGLTSGASPVQYQIKKEERIVSSDAVPIVEAPTDQTTLRMYVDEVNTPLTAVTNMTIAELDVKVKNVYSVVTKASDIEALGFGDVDLGEKPHDVTLYYKFTKGKAAAGQRPIYSLSLRGTTSGHLGTKPLSFEVSTKTVQSVDAVQLPANPTTQAEFDAIVAGFSADVPTTSTISTLSQFLQPTEASFDISVLEALNFTGINVPVLPSDLSLTFTFTEGTKVEGINVDYTFKVYFYSSSPSIPSQSKTYVISSSDPYVIPPTQSDLQNYMDGWSATAPTNRSFVDLDALIQKSQTPFTPQTILDYGLNDVEELVNLPLGAYLRYTFTNLLYVDGSKATYQFTLYIDTTLAELLPVTKSITFTSSDNVSYPTDQVELNNILAGITFIKPNKTIEFLDQVIQTTKTTLDANALLALGFVNPIIPSKDPDVTLEYTFVQKYVADGQNGLYLLTMYGRTAAGLVAQREFEVVSADKYDKPTTENGLAALLNSYNGTAPSKTKAQWDLLVMENEAHFDLNVMTGKYGFTNVNPLVKDGDVTLTYKFTKNELVPSRPAQYTFEIIGRTTAGLTANVRYTVNSSDIYVAPTTRGELRAILDSFNLTPIAYKRSDEYNNLLANNVVFDALAISKMDLNISLQTMPSDVKLKYSFTRDPLVAAGQNQTYTLSVSAYTSIYEETSTKQFTATDALSSDQISVSADANAFKSLFVDNYYSEKTISVVPKPGVRPLNQIASLTFVSTPGVAVSYNVVISKDFEVSANAVFSKGTFRETVSFVVYYATLADVILRDKANFEVEQAKQALGNFNATASSFNYDVLSTNTEATLENYTNRLGVNRVEIFDLLDSIDFTITNNDDDVSVSVRAVIQNEHTSYSGDDLVVEFVLYGYDRNEVIGNRLITAAKEDIEAEWGFSGAKIVSSLKWNALKDASTLNVNTTNYFQLLGIERLLTIELLNTSTFTISTNESEYTKHISLILRHPNSNISLGLRTFTFDIEASDKASQIADKNVAKFINPLKSLDGSISTHTWEGDGITRGLGDVFAANKNDFDTVFGIKKLTDEHGNLLDLDLIDNISFKATNGVGNEIYTKKITAVIEMADTTFDPSYLTINFKVHAPDKVTQIADAKVKAAIQAISLMSFTSTHNWNVIQNVTSVSKNAYATALGLANSDEIRAVESATFNLSTSVHTYQRKLEIVLVQSDASAEYREVRIMKELVARNKAALDQGDIDSKVQLAINALEGIKNSPVQIKSRHAWSTLQILGTTNKNDYMRYLGIDEIPNISSMQTVTFTSSASTISFSRKITARITMPGTTYTPAQLEVSFDLAASNKHILDANVAAEKALADIKLYGIETSTQNWNSIKPFAVDAFQLNKTSYASLLGLPTPSINITGPSVTALTFNVKEKNNSSALSNKERYILTVEVKIYVQDSTLSEDYLTHTFTVIASDKAALDAADASDASTLVLESAYRSLLSLKNVPTNKNWNLLRVLVGSSAVTKTRFAAELGIQVSQADYDNINAVNSAIFTITDEASNGETYTIGIKVDLEHGGLSKTVEWKLKAHDKNVLDDNAAIGRAIDYMNNDFYDSANNAFDGNGRLISKLSWATLNNPNNTTADKTNYSARIGMQYSSILSSVRTMNVTISPMPNMDYTKKVVMVIDAPGTTYELAKRTFTFLVIPSDKSTQERDIANKVVDNAIASLKTLNNEYSLLDWELLLGITASPLPTLEDWYSRLGVADSVDVAMLDSLTFKNIQANEDHSITLIVTVMKAATSRTESERTATIKVYGANARELNANAKIRKIFANIDTISKISTLNWNGPSDDVAGLKDATAADKTNYMQILGVSEVELIDQIEQANFVIKDTHFLTFGKRVSVTLYENGTSMTEEERTYTFDIASKDKAALDVIWSKEESEKKLQAAKNALDYISENLASKLKYEDLSKVDVEQATAQTLFSHFDIDIEEEKREELQAILDLMDMIVFVKNARQAESYTITVRCTLLMEGAISTGWQVFLLIKAADKRELDANAHVMKAREQLGKISQSFASWAALQSQSSADLSNYTTRLGLAADYILDGLTTLNFTWKNSTTDTYRIDIVATFSLEYSTLPPEMYTFNFSLNAVNKGVLDTADSNRDIKEVLAVITAFKDQSSTWKWDEGLSDLPSATTLTYEQVYGFTGDEEVRKIDSVEFTARSNGVGTYQLLITAVANDKYTNLTLEARSTTFIVSAKDKAILEANDRINAAKAILNPLFVDDVSSELVWNEIRNVTTATKDDFEVILGFDIDNVTPFRVLDEMEISVSDIVGKTYMKQLIVVLKSEPTDIPEDERTYTFEMRSVDKDILDSNDRVNAALAAMRENAPSPTYSTLDWEFIDLPIGDKYYQSDYVESLGIIEDERIQVPHGASFTITRRPGTYSLEIEFEVIDEPDSDITNKKYTFVLYAKNKQTLDANDAINLTKTSALGADESYSLHDWSQFRVVQSADKDTVNSLYGLNIAGTSNLDLIEVTSIVLDPNDATDDTQGEEYVQTLTFLLDREHTTLSAEDRTFSINVKAANKDILDANDQVERTLTALRALEANSTLNWSSISSVTAATQLNYSTLLGVTANSEIGRGTNTVAFTVANVTGVNDWSNISSNKKYVKKVTAVISQQFTDMSVAERTYSWELAAKNKEYKDLEDLTLNEKDRISKTASKTTTFSTRTTRIPSAQNFPGFTDATSYSTWMSDANYASGTMVAGTKTTWTLKSRDTRNGRVTITSKIIATGDRATALGVPAITHDWFLSGFKTSDSAMSDVLNATQYDSWGFSSSREVGFSRGNLPASAGSYGGLFGWSQTQIPAVIQEQMTYNGIGFDKWTYSEPDTTWYPGWYNATAWFTHADLPDTVTKFKTTYVRSNDAWRKRGDNIVTYVSRGYSTGGMEYIGDRPWQNTTRAVSRASLQNYTVDAWVNARTRMNTMHSNAHHSYINNTFNIDSRLDVDLYVVWGAAPGSRASMAFRFNHWDTPANPDWAMSPSYHTVSGRWVMFSF